MGEMTAITGVEPFLQSSGSEFNSQHGLMT